MTRYHWLRLRAACHPTEDQARVDAALRFVAGVADEEYAAGLVSTTMETHHGLPLVIAQETLERSRAIRDLLERIVAIPDALATLQSTVAARTDDDGVFYLRLDKQAAAAGELRLLDGEDAIQVRLKLEVYPSTRAAAIAAVSAMLAARP